MPVTAVRALTIPLLFFTQSRTGLVGMAVVLAITVLFATDRRLKWRISAGIVGVFILLAVGDWMAGGTVTDRLFDSKSILDRQRYIEAGLAALSANVWLGSGSEALRLAGTVGASPSAHVVYLSLLAKYGIIGFCIYAAFLLAPLIGVAARPLRYVQSARFLVAVLIVPLLFMYIGYDVMEFFEPQYFAFGIGYSILVNKVMTTTGKDSKNGA
jgi:O-antigen ligase